MFTFEASKNVPKFIMQDKNGYAVAKAIEKAMNMMNGIIADGVKLLADIDSMPEWRLDEMAWELNILSNAGDDIDIKRNWIRAVQQYSRQIGTPDGIVKFLETRFDHVWVDEWWKYGADPYHFTVNISSDWTEESLAWAMLATERVKNLRSVLDSFSFVGGEVENSVTMETSVVSIARHEAITAE